MVSAPTASPKDTPKLCEERHWIPSADETRWVCSTAAVVAQQKIPTQQNMPYPTCWWPWRAEWKGDRWSCEVPPPVVYNPYPYYPYGYGGYGYGYNVYQRPCGAVWGKKWGLAVC